MATPGPTYRGWKFDPTNDRLDIYYNGTRIGHVDASGLSIASGGVTVSAGGFTLSAGGLNVSSTGAHVLDGTNLKIPNLPTSDPGVAGQLWSDSNVLTVSAGA